MEEFGYFAVIVIGGVAVLAIALKLFVWILFSWQW